MTNRVRRFCFVAGGQSGLGKSLQYHEVGHISARMMILIRTSIDDRTRNVIRPFSGYFRLVGHVRLLMILSV